MRVLGEGRSRQGVQKELVRQMHPCCGKSGGSAAKCGTHRPVQDTQGQISATREEPPHMKVPQGFAVELNENQSWIFLMFLQECSASFRLQTLVQSSGRDVTCLL